MSTAKPYKLITVNTAPDRASRMVRKLAEDVKDRYVIIHCVNAASKLLADSVANFRGVTGLTTSVAEIEEVESLVSLYRPDVLVSNVTPSVR